MRRFIFILTLALAALQGFAQKEAGKLTFVPKIGINLANVAGDDLYYLHDGIGDKKLEPKQCIGIVAGIEGEYQLSAPLSLSAGLFYSLQGHKYDDIELQKDYSATLHYINVPIMLNLYAIKGLALKAGIQPGYAFYKKISYDEKIGNSWGSYSTTGTNYASFDLGIPVGISYDLDKVRIDARYILGLLDLNKLDIGGKYSNRVIQVTVGYIL